MLGRTVYRIAKLAVSVAIALIIGSQLISSAYSVALSYKLGNVLPFLGVLLISFLFAWLSGRSYTWKVADIVANVLAGTALIVSSLSVIFVLLSYGLLVSILGCGGYVGILMSVRSPSLRKQIHNSNVAGAIENVSWMNGVRSSVETGQRLVAHLGYSVFILPPNSITKIYSLIQDRPRLPITVSRFLDADILFVTEANPKQVSSIVRVMNSIDIQNVRKVSGLFAQYLLSLPVVEKQHSYCSYVLITEATLIEKLIADTSIMLSLYTSSLGPVLVTRKNDALGVDAMDIPNSRLLNVLLRRKVEDLLPSDEVISAVA